MIYPTAGVSLRYLLPEHNYREWGGDINEIRASSFLPDMFEGLRKHGYAVYEKAQDVDGLFDFTNNQPRVPTPIKGKLLPVLYYLKGQ